MQNANLSTKLRNTFDLESDIEACEYAIGCEEDVWVLVAKLDSSRLFYSDGAVVDDRRIQESELFAGRGYAEKFLSRVWPQVLVDLVVVPLSEAAAFRLEKNKSKLERAGC